MTPTTGRIAAVIVALAASLGTAQAQSAGDWVIGAGALHYAPQDKSEALRFTSPVQQVIPDSGADVRSTTTLGLNVHYFFTDHWAVEGVLGIPPRIKLDGAGSLAPVGRMGSARLWAPTVLGKYFFGEPDDRFRVSVGAGLTYNQFRSIRLEPGLQGAVGGALGLPPGATTTSASIGSKWAPVFNVGVNYAIDRHWGISGSVSYIPLRLRANLTTRAGGQTIATSTTRIKINPVIPFVYLTYRF